MSVKNLLLTALASALLCSCQQEELSPAFIPDEGEIQLDMLYPGASTRVSDQGFEATDEIGVYVTASDALLQLAGNVVNNEQFTFNGTSWTSSRKVYWNEGMHNVYAYYPYSKNINDVADYNFDVQVDQSTAEGYTKSDFLWSSAFNIKASQDPVSMQFQHRLSKVVVELVKGEMFSGDIPSDAEVYILGTVPNALIDLSTGDVTKHDFGAIKPIKCLRVEDGKYTAIVVPQRLTNKQAMVEVIIGNVSYIMDGTINYYQGYMHTMTITLNQSPEQIEIEIGGNKDDWE